MDLYGEELRVWKECWKDGAGDGDGGEKEGKMEKMAGSWEW